MINPKIIKKQKKIVITLILLIIITIFISLGMSSNIISYRRIIPILFGKGNFSENFIIFSIRLPRLFITLLSGIALALSGAILQSLTQNELADPGIIGINSGAGIGVSIFYLFFPLQNFFYLLPIIAFLSALLCSFIIYFFSLNKNFGLNPTRLVLTGIGFSMALNGLLILIFSMVDPFKVDFIAKWLAGNIWGTDWPFVWAILPWLTVLISFSFYKANQLNILELGEQISIGVGLSLKKERFYLLISSVALAALAVSVAGRISFIGLMAPHIAKTLIGRRHQLSLLITILIGGWLLIFADMLGRNIIQPNGIPTGIMVSIIGAPYFIYLLIKK